MNLMKPDEILTFKIGTQVFKRNNSVFIIPPNGTHILKIHGPPMKVIVSLFLGHTRQAIECQLKKMHMGINDSEHLVSNVIAMLSSRNLLEEDSSQGQFSSKDRYGIATLLNSLFLRSEIGQVTGFRTRLYLCGMSILALVSSIGIVIELTTILMGSWEFIESFPNPLELGLIGLGLSLWIVGHETAHAFVAGNYGVGILLAGISRFGGLLPLPYLDIRKAWAIDQWQHAQIAAAGPFFDLVALYLCLFLSHEINDFGIVFIYISGFGIIFLISNCNPLRSSDLSLMLEASSQDPELRKKALGQLPSAEGEKVSVDVYRAIIFLFVCWSSLLTGTIGFTFFQRVLQ